MIVQAECQNFNLFFIDNTNIFVNKGLNGSSLHLNYKGTVKLVNNFLSSIRLWIATYMCNPERGEGSINVEPSFEISDNGNKSYLCCENAPLLMDDPSPLVGSTLKHHSTPLLVSDLELNQNLELNLNVQNQDPRLLSSQKDGVESSVNLSTEVNENDPKSTLQALKAKRLDRPIIVHLNINFLEPRYEPLKALIQDNVDILLVSETKLDDTFPNCQFQIEGYEKPIRLDRDRYGGGILFFIRDFLPCIELKSLSNIEGIFIELTLRNSKWLIMEAYNPHRESISNFLSNVSKELDKYLPFYENLLLLGDFNSSMCEKEMKEFCDMYGLDNLIKGPTCYKNASNPSSIDVMLTNKKSNFQNSITLETGISDFHKMTNTVLKKYVKKHKPVIIIYRDYKSFDSQTFRNNLILRLEQCQLLNIQNFKSIVMEILNYYAPMKKKVVRGNNAPFMNCYIFPPKCSLEISVKCWPVFIMWIDP